MGLLDKIAGGNTLYYPGCMTKFVLRDLGRSYEELLRKAGMDFIKLKDLEVCCGSPALNGGYEEDFRILAENNLKVFREHGVKRIITSCPACLRVFTQEYPKILKGWDIEVEHATQALLKAIKEGKLKVDKKDLVVTYHDPCHMGRYCRVYQEPREILHATGARIKEMELSKEQAFCCGGGGGVKANFPELADSIAKERMEQARKTGAGVLVTCCPMCYSHLKDNSKAIKVKEISELLE